MKRPPIFKLNRLPEGITGEVVIHYFRDGLLAKSADISMTEDAEDEGLFIPGIRLIITLQGKTELQFEDRHIILKAGRRPFVALLPISEPVMGICRFSKGQAQKELVIFIEPGWCNQSGFSQTSDYRYLQNLQKAHLEIIPLLADKRILMAANSFWAKQNTDSLPLLLSKESDCLNLIAECLIQLEKFTHKQSASPERERIFRLTQMLLSGNLDNDTLPQIAQKLHTNVTTLQTQFKQIHGISIMHYLRQIKLERAYYGLIQGITVSQAAEIAGYVNPDNFSTAFRRYFGITPRQARKDKEIPFI